MQKTATMEEAWERKYPEQVVLAITKNADDVANFECRPGDCPLILGEVVASHVNTD